MANDLVKRFIKKDGSQRISFYRDEYAENPRCMTDEPLHCCDWGRNYSITTKVDPSYSDARSLINQMLVWYGKREVIIDALCKGIENNRLEYNRSARRWELKEYFKFYSEKEYKWYDAEWFDGRKDEIDLGTLVEACLDSTIDELCDPKYWTDEIKMMSYGFGYYGEISFDHEFSTDSEGICWLEKDEFTSLIMAIFHLDEELEHRSDLSNVKDADFNHLNGDMKRIYSKLIHEWIYYLSYLNKHYPYMISLAIRTNPFDTEADVHVKE